MSKPIVQKHCNVYVCDVCDSYRSSSKKGLDLHMKYSHKIENAGKESTRVYVCSTCGKKFKKYTTLQNHIKRKTHCI